MLVFRNVHLTSGQYVRLNLRYLLRARPLLLLALLLPLAGLAYWLVEVLRGGYSLYEAARDQWMELSFMLFVLLLIPLSLWRNLRRNYALSQLMRAPATYTFDAAGIRTDAPAVQAALTWANATVAYRLPPYAVLLVNAASGYFLDFRSLELPGTEADFWQLLRQHGVRCK